LLFERTEVELCDCRAHLFDSVDVPVDRERRLDVRVSQTLLYD